MELTRTRFPSSERRARRVDLVLDGAPLATRSSDQPWRYRSWIFPRDPDFAAKAARVLDLYSRIFEGVPLGPDDYVISADEKSQLQALARRHCGLVPGPGRVRRVEFEYKRGGTLAYMGAYDVHRAHLIGSVAPRPGSRRSWNSQSAS